MNMWTRKKDKRTKQALIAVAVLVIASGCIDIGDILPSSSGDVTGKAVGSEYPGLLIERFKPDQETIYNGESTEFNLVIANTGGAYAKDIKAELFRLGDLTVVSTNPIDLGTLAPPDESTGTPGQKREYAWQVTAPSDIKGTVSYNPGVRISYSYSSEGWSDLLATTKEQAKVEASMPILRSGVTKAPVTIAVITPNKLLYEGDEGSSVSIRVDVVNGASGIVYAGAGLGAEDMNKINSLSISVPSKYLELDETVGQVNGEYWCCSEECESLDPDRKIELSWKKAEENGMITLTKTAADSSDISESLRLQRGKQKSFVCQFKVKPEVIGLEQIIPVQAFGDYTYMIEAARGIIVVES